MAQASGEDRASDRSRFESFGRKLDERFGNVGPKVEEEIRKVISYLNDEVVPEVRRNSSSALRTASEHLGRLADHLERSGKSAPTPPAGAEKPE